MEKRRYSYELGVRQAGDGSEDIFIENEHGDRAVCITLDQIPLLIKWLQQLEESGK